MKICIACGMPMNTKEDHSMGDESKPYCRFCSKPDGAMLSYEEKLADMTKFIQTKQGLDEAAAREIAKNMMLSQPAWR
jgi:Putative zinc ribbon domain